MGARCECEASPRSKDSRVAERLYWKTDKAQPQQDDETDEAAGVDDGDGGTGGICAGRPQAGAPSLNVSAPTKPAPIIRPDPQQVLHVAVEHHLEVVQQLHDAQRWGNQLATELAHLREVKRWSEELTGQVNRLQHTLEHGEADMEEARKRLKKWAVMEATLAKARQEREQTEVAKARLLRVLHEEQAARVKLQEELRQRTADLAAAQEACGQLAAALGAQKGHEHGRAAIVRNTA
eukprot:gnl/TRDRNA2_/TRDRNA2_41991_c0_seq1.p1 gnl/TRDRNA2_/TRDRNA2_41991_c0~~gnl/TRDRNA2_/TRDRNA2_41991_c0_seq1.p1  ORF type:complete len:236 (-),score=62.07 gnl/TRDRNA2_/TRDRNA2_41991_c0_seq1:280-987(-)